MKIILQDEEGRCWKVSLTNDMNLLEIFECIGYQFYSEELRKPRQGGKK